MVVRLLPLLVVFIAPLAYALDFESNEWVISRHISIDFPPTEAFLFVEPENGNPIRVPAALVAPAQQLEDEGDWLVGGRVPLPETSGELKCAVVVLGESGEREFIPSESLSYSNEDMFGRSLGNLREEVLRSKRELNEFDDEHSKLSSELQRLERDMEGITEVGKLADARQELEEIDRKLRDIKETEGNLKNFIGNVEETSEPRFFRRREAQLTTQLTMIARATQEAESSEDTRKGQAGVDIREKLEVIRATQFADEGRLARELAALQQRYDALQGTSSRSGNVPSAVTPGEQRPPADQASRVDENRGADLEAEYLSR